MFYPIQTQYDDIHTFHEGYAFIRNNSKLGTINLTGNLCIPFLYYDRIIRPNGSIHFPEYIFYEGCARVANKIGQFGCIDPKNNIVIPFEYDSISHFKGGRAFAVRNGTHYLITKENKVLLSFKSENFVCFGDELIAVIYDGKIGYIDYDGNQKIPFQFDASLDGVSVSFSEGIAPVRKNGHLGYIDRNGDEIIPFGNKYSQLFPFFNGYAIVKTKEGYGCLNRHGSEVISPVFDRIMRISDNKIIVHNDDGFFMIDLIGNLKKPLDANDIISCIYETKKSHLICVKNEAYGILQSNGEIIYFDKFDRINYLTDRLFIARRGKMNGVINVCGETVIPFVYDEIIPNGTQSAIANYCGQYGVLPLI